MTARVSSDQTPSETSIGRYLSILHRFWQIHLDRSLSSYGIGAAQLPILMFLYRGDAVSQADVVRHLRTDKGATARTIRKLVAEGYIERAACPDDGRAYRIRLTARAHAVRSELRALLRGWTDAVTVDLSEAERAVLLDLMGRMLPRADALLRQDPDGRGHHGEDAP